MCAPLSPSSTLFFSLHVAEASTFPADDCASVPSALLFLFALLRHFPTSPLIRSLVSSFFGVCLAVQFIFFSFLSSCCHYPPSPTSPLHLLFMYFCCSLPLAAQFLFLCCYFNTHVYKYTKAQPSQVELRWAQQPHCGTNYCRNLLSPNLCNFWFLYLFNEFMQFFYT